MFWLTVLLIDSEGELRARGIQSARQISGLVFFKYNARNRWCRCPKDKTVESRHIYTFAADATESLYSIYLRILHTTNLAKSWDHS